ncbi:MAG: exosortase X [Flavobacteriales bacterium]
MIQRFVQNPFFRFLIIGTLAYLAWVVLYQYYIEPETNFDEWIIHVIIQTSELFMNSFGFDLTPYQDGVYSNHIGVLGSSGVTVGAPCNGLVLLVLFLIFILAFPGKWLHKIWFIPLGLVLIHIVNCFRVIALALIVVDHPEWLDFNHDYTFTVVVYSFVFFLWYIWVNKFSPLKKKNIDQENIS